MKSPVKNDPFRAADGIPRRVWVAGRPFRVTLHETPGATDKTSSDLLQGQIDISGGEIRLLCDGNQSPEHLWRVLLHEVLHCLIEDYHVDSMMDSQGVHDEVAIQQLANGLHDFLARNALLVAPRARRSRRAAQAQAPAA